MIIADEAYAIVRYINTSANSAPVSEDILSKIRITDPLAPKPPEKQYISVAEIRGIVREHLLYRVVCVKACTWFNPNDV